MSRQLPSYDSSSPPSSLRTLIEKRFHGRLGSPWRRENVSGRYSNTSRIRSASPVASAASRSVAASTHVPERPEPGLVSLGHLTIADVHELGKVGHGHLVAVRENTAPHRVEQHVRQVMGIGDRVGGRLECICAGQQGLEPARNLHRCRQLTARAASGSAAMRVAASTPGWSRPVSATISHDTEPAAGTVTGPRSR